MLYRPVAGFASYTGSVTALPGPCCSQDSPRPVPGFWKHNHGGGHRSPCVRHLAVLEEISSALLRAGRSLTELSWEGSSRSPPWLPEQGGSLDSRAVAVVTESTIVLPTWDPRSSSPVQLETEGLAREEPIPCLDVKERSVGVECSELDESGVPGLTQFGAGDRGRGDGNAGQVELGDAKASNVGVVGAVGGAKKVGDASTGLPTPPKKVHPNKGKMPWNKGKRHSPETIARIRQRTIEAMCNPAIREKLRSCAINQRCSDETKAKIRAAIAANWDAKRFARKSQDACVNEWRELVAEEARIGGYGDSELQWDSYRTILRELIVEEKQRVKAMKKELQRKESKRSQRPIAPAGSVEHRQKISEAIRAKWSDPDYRRKVSEGLQKFVRDKTGVPSRPPRKRATAPSTVVREPKDPRRTASKVPSTVRKPTQRSPVSPGMRSSVEEPPRPATFVDPRANEKLERIRRIQAGRQMMELKKQEAAERARLLMAEAEKAIKALEAVAATDEGARLSLAETRKLLAEAADKIKSAESRR